MNGKTKQELGITLIVLIISIILLIILAMVTIATISSNGIFMHAHTAKESSQVATEIENIKIALNEYKLAQHSDGRVQQEIHLASFLEEKEWCCYALEREENVIVGVTSGNEYQVSKDGEVKSQGVIPSQHLGEYVAYDCFTGVDSELLTYTTSANKTGNSTSQTYTLTKENTKNLKWILLGTDEKGNLLITTADPVFTGTNEILTIKGQEGYVSGIEELNHVSSIFGHGTFANTGAYTYVDIGSTGVTSGARSIQVEDINKAQGYTPSTTFDTYVYKIKRVSSPFGGGFGGGFGSINTGASLIHCRPFSV